MEDMKELFDRGIGVGKQIGAPVVLEGLGAPFAVVPANCTVHSLDAMQWLDRPRHTKESVQVRDAESFVAYLRRFERENTVVAVDLEHSEMRAIIDWHGPELPQHGHHQVVYQLVTDKAWQRWTANNNKFLDQAAFGDHCEENRYDITEPDAATILEMVRLVEGKTEVEWASGYRDKDGWRLKYSQQTKTTVGGQEVELFDKMTLTLNVFPCGQKFSMRARVRTKIVEGKLTLAYVLERPDLVLREAFDAETEYVSQRISSMVIQGRLRAL